MKKFIAGFVSIVLMLSLVAVPISAKVGDKTGEVVYTDISAYINHYPISAYAYDGGMVVVAEDLRQYGFTVEWDPESRMLNIVPDYSKLSIAGMSPVYKNGRRLGQQFADALTSDVKVSLNGVQIHSYAINGFSMVKLEDLAPVGEFTWDPSTRMAKLWIEWAGIKEYKPIPEAPAIEYFRYIGSYFTPLEGDFRDWTGYHLTINQIDQDAVLFEFQYEKAGRAVYFSANPGTFIDDRTITADGTVWMGGTEEGSGGNVKYTLTLNDNSIDIYVDLGDGNGYNVTFWGLADTIDSIEAEMADQR